MAAWYSYNHLSHISIAMLVIGIQSRQLYVLVAKSIYLTYLCQWMWYNLGGMPKKKISADISIQYAFSRTALVPWHIHSVPWYTFTSVTITVCQRYSIYNHLSYNHPTTGMSRMCRSHGILLTQLCQWHSYRLQQLFQERSAQPRQCQQHCTRSHHIKCTCIIGVVHSSQ